VKGADRALGGAVPVAAKSAVARMSGRFGWGLADQLLSSATNFLLGLLVARAVSPSELGAFSLAYATFSLSLGAVRAIAGELLVVRHSAVSDDQWRQGVQGAAGTALMGGAVVGAGCLVVAALGGGTFRTVFAIVGIVLPALLVQDVWRFAFFAGGRGGSAFANDGVWAVAMFAAFSILMWTDTVSAGWFTVAWAGSGALATLAGLFQLRVLPSGPRAAFAWLRRHRDLAPRFFAEFVVGSGVSNLTFFGIGAVAGLDELGRLRAGQIAVGPLNVLFGGVGLVATPEGVQLLRESPRRLVQGCRWISVALAAAVLGWGVVVLMLPHDVGALLLGTNWDIARSLLVPLLLGLTGFGSAYGAWTGLRSLAAARRSLRARCIDGAVTIVCGLAGAYLAGATGAAWGYAAAGWLRSPNAWWQFSRAVREYESLSAVRP
jgi:O-antigen/teichoic acid export membrane protein